MIPPRRNKSFQIGERRCRVEAHNLNNLLDARTSRQQDKEIPTRDEVRRALIEYGVLCRSNDPQIDVGVFLPELRYQSVDGREKKSRSGNRVIVIITSRTTPLIKWVVLFRPSIPGHHFVITALHQVGSIPMAHLPQSVGEAWHATSTLIFFIQGFHHIRIRLT